MYEYCAWYRERVRAEVLQSYSYVGVKALAEL
jgi:hypothetical protein